MAKKRKDLKGHALRDGEYQRSSDNRYVYSYTDARTGKRRSLYAKTLQELRQKEDDFHRDRLDGIDHYSKRTVTVNDMYDRYMKIRTNLASTTRSNYDYMYDRFIRPSALGKSPLEDVQFSTIVAFYASLLEAKLSMSVVGTMQTLLHPVFALAVRDNLIRSNPADGATKEIKNQRGERYNPVRDALTPEEQKAFLDYVNNSEFDNWAPLFTVLFGTGMRIGECVGLTWRSHPKKDVDLDSRIVDVNHALVYYAKPDPGNHRRRKSVLQITPPKTNAGYRQIHMIDPVYDAFRFLYEERKLNGPSNATVDGVSDFVFLNRFGQPLHQSCVNRAIQRIVAHYNDMEREKAKRERRKPLLLPQFSSHICRHTFATRLCQAKDAGSHLKEISTVLGHEDIETTLNIYVSANSERQTQAIDSVMEMGLF